MSRPRNRFANEKHSQIPLPTTQNLSKDNLTIPKDFKTNQLQNLFNDEYFKTANVSQFALALVQALRHVEQSTKMYHIESFFKLRFSFIFLLLDNKKQT